VGRVVTFWLALAVNVALFVIADKLGHIPKPTDVLRSPKASEDAFVSSTSDENLR
jgi:hypothetical protein